MTQARKILIVMLLQVFSLVGVERAALAYDPKNKPLLAHETPEDLKNIGIEEHLGTELDLSVPFKSDDGRDVKLGEFFDGQKPVLLTIVYYNCPSLCNYHLNGLLDVFKKMDMVAGREFRLVAISMDHRETADVASKKKANYLKEYQRPGAESGWHFLTGTEENIKKIADQVGFKFRWDEQGQQYAHASAAIISTPDGKVSRYLYGIEFPPKTLRLALLEAGEGRVGSLVDQLILFCYQFDPAKNKYTLYAFNLVRLGAILMVLILAVILVPAWLREKRRAV